MKKWASLLFIFLIIGCANGEAVETPQTVAVGLSPTVTQAVVVPRETAVLPTETAVIPTITPTQLPSVAPTHTPTPEPTEAPQFILPTLPPVIDAPLDSFAAYRLREWLDLEAADLVAQMTLFANDFAADYGLHTYYGDRGREQILLSGYEFILRYPDSEFRNEVEWQMIDANTYRPGAAVDAIMAQQIEDALNSDVTIIDSLNTYLESNGFKIGENDCLGCLPFSYTIPNLLGDGKEVIILPIERSSSLFDGRTLIMIRQEVTGKFIVTPIVSQWAARPRFSGGITSFEARHITGDPQPELVVELWGNSGSMLFDTLYFYRWNGENLEPLSGTPLSFSGGVLGEEWGFIEGDDVSRLRLESPVTGEQSIYAWTGSEYEIVETRFAELPKDPLDILRTFMSRLYGKNLSSYTEVVNYLEEALRIPKQEYEPYGLESYLSMRFVLGMNYVYLEDEDKARSVFEGLREETVPENIQFFPEAAGAFLEAYTGLETAYVACQMAYAAILATDIDPYELLIPLCDLDKLFIERIEQADSDNILNLFDEGELIDVQQLDLNGDSQLDWFVAVAHPTLGNNPNIGIWTILQTEKGLEVIKLRSFSWSSEGEIAAEVFTESPFEAPLISVLWDGNFTLYQLVKENDEWRIDYQFVTSYVSDYRYEMIDSLFKVNLSLDETQSYFGYDGVTYQWDELTAEFTVISRSAPNSLGIPFREALDMAEMLLLDEGDFTAVIPNLTLIADEYEPDTEHENTWRNLLPKTLYLLGLAHELAGNEAEAVQAYWQLWHDYPTSPYALMASAKLEEK